MKKILITGASGGIGSSISEKFFSEGFRLILTSSSKIKLESLRDKYGSNNFFYILDFNASDLEKTISIISEEHKDLDIIVNNAGITDDSLILRMANEQWDSIIQANLSSNARELSYNEIMS